MRVVAGCLAAAVLVAPATADASARPSGSNAGHVATPSASARPAQSSGPDEQFHVYRKPVEEYTDRKSCALDMSYIVDGSLVASLGNQEACPIGVNFSAGLYKHTVPDGGWISWGEPPFTEDSSPEVISTDDTTITLTYSRNQRAGGIEIEPDPFDAHTFTVEFFSEGVGTGELLGTITRTVDGRDGARLFAAKTKTRMRSVVITSNDGVGFALAQIRG